MRLENATDHGRIELRGKSIARLRAAGHEFAGFVIQPGRAGAAVKFSKAPRHVRRWRELAAFESGQN